ncbi:MAG TPA: TetR/AcrR family transcriptional regulator [Actinomycetota bacterium]|nr:TetR/AcrR family transcriptional regulator [Actinomycetota bacterium]
MTTATTRSRARKGEGDKLRERLLEAAEGLLVRAGHPDNVSVRAVATAAGCTPPSIYLHFADKDELLMEVCERRFADLDRYAQDAAEGSDDPLESLRLRARAYIRFGLDHPQHYRLLMMTVHEKSLDELDWESSAGVKAFMNLVGAVQRCVDGGALPAETGAHQTALGLWATMHGITSLLITFPNFEWGDREELVDHLLDVHIEGLLSV